ncbi:MAG: sulfatase [Verrucomicrobia bacterium]|nr:sulfatase [Verrucomicrobiota bacterium]
MFLFSGNLTAQTGAPRPEKPNVLLLLTDDLGWQDVVCYDIDEPTPYETPNIDALAKEGVMFWQGYSPSPVCMPSRSAILSGIHPARAQLIGVGGGMPPVPHHFRGWAYMSPWSKQGGATTKRTIATVLRNNGYFTGHAGKWHMGVHNAQTTDAQGFDYARSRRGATHTTPDRSKIFASRDPGATYKLDANGYPQHDNLDDALKFLDLAQGKDQPFFLYWCTWLVHGPIHTRSRALLEKYCDKMGVPFPDDPGPIQTMDEDGQKNPYYGAMVEMLDYYTGQLMKHLKETDDPRWPGHKLIENTYIIFTSDNGGMVGDPKEKYTDNRPLQKGKISAMEGGTRVPLIIVGPGIPKGVQTDVVANGLDFYPTILSWTKTPVPENKTLDGCDLSALLAKGPTDPSLVRESDGSVRDTMIWHFPQSCAQESTIRIGDYKLVHNYFDKPEWELFRLYDSEGGPQKRVDWEEAKNLAAAMPEKTTAMAKRLEEILTEMKAGFPTLNPQCPRNLGEKLWVPTVLSHEQNSSTITVSYQENGAKVVRADLIYKLSGPGGWLRNPATLASGNTVTADLPADTTHYYINLIDENNYLVSYPQIVGPETPSPNSELIMEKAVRRRD